MPSTFKLGSNVDETKNIKLEADGTGQLVVKDGAGTVFGRLNPSLESIAGLIQIATDAEAQALTDDDKALTPAKLAAAFQGGNQSLISNGYQKLAGGLIIQWGAGAQTGSIAPGGTGSASMSWPITFPNGYLAGVVFNESTSINTALSNPTASQVTFSHQNIGTISGNGAPIYIVVGF